MLSPNQAALKAGVSRKTIMNHIRSMSLKATRNNENHWVIQPTDLANWMKQRGKQSQPSPTSHTNDTISGSINLSDQVELATTKLELLYTRKELETAKQETDSLRDKVDRLEEEVRATRQEVSDAWKRFGDLADIIKAVISPPKQEPLVLTPDYRVGNDEVSDENLFRD